MKGKVEKVAVSVYKVPTDGVELDGTLEWDSTTMVLVEASAGGVTGLGFTYADRATGVLVQEKLRPVVLGCDAMDVQGAWEKMVRTIRNLGRPGICSMAISAVDIALWDLKARLLEVPLVKLFGQVREEIPAYGSGGFTSYSIERLQEQLSGWVSSGIRCVKMKVGREPERDVERVRAAVDVVQSPRSKVQSPLDEVHGPQSTVHSPRSADESSGFRAQEERAGEAERSVVSGQWSAVSSLGAGAELYVDANGAYARKEALEMGERFAEFGVSWFEEPVSSDDLEWLRMIRERAPACMQVAAGEYGYDAVYFRRMLEAGAVDVLQADATRCAGITGFMQAGALCEAFMTPLSAHTAPSIHLHPCCALGRAINVEYFYDHYRIEQMFFEGAAWPVEGVLRPDLSRTGLGLEFKRKQAAKYEVK